MERSNIWSNSLNQLTLENNLHTGNLTTQLVPIKRCHGLGNVICLLPVLDTLHALGCHVQVITNPLWTHAFSRMRPDYDWMADTGDSDPEIIDLDEMTKRKRPTEHRVDEFAHLLHITAPLPAPQITAPHQWSKPFEHLTGCVVFAPEGGHPSRTWPTINAAQVKAVLPYEKLVLVGTSSEPDIPSDFDTRGQLELHELLGLLAVADTVITMDSGILHLATALQIPTVAIFGGMNPHFRVRDEQRVVVLQTNLLCCPCSKNETCFDRFDCIKAATAEDVAQAVSLARETDRCVMQKIPPLVQGVLNPLLAGIRLPRK
jgi:glycosyl transferase family 9 (putative heptosyltransferase)